MAGHIPAKPPRARARRSSEDTGVIVRVIRNLSAPASPSLDPEDLRAVERFNLEKEFRESDLRLDNLLAEHHSSLNKVFNTFGHVSDEITSAKTRVKAVKTNLEKCKALLNCRREVLLRLWLEGVEHRHAVEVLDHIDKVRRRSDLFTKLVHRQQYDKAEEVLMNCLQEWTESLDQIGGLAEVYEDLNDKKQRLYEPKREEAELQSTQMAQNIFFDVSDSKACHEISEFNEPVPDINSYFSKRRPQRIKKEPLFKFSNSSMNDYAYANGLRLHGRLQQQGVYCDTNRV